MSGIGVGDKVQLAIHPELIFEVIKMNQDYTYELQIRLSETKILTYGNISSEMLKKIKMDSN